MYTLILYTLYIHIYPLPHPIPPVPLARGFRLQVVALWVAGVERVAARGLPARQLPNQCAWHCHSHTDGGRGGARRPGGPADVCPGPAAVRIVAIALPVGDPTVRWSLRSRFHSSQWRRSGGG